MKFEYWQSKANQQWYWHLKAANGRKIADSGEGYTTKQGCLNAIDLFKKNCGSAPVVEIKAA